MKAVMDGAGIAGDAHLTQSKIRDAANHARTHTLTGWMQRNGVGLGRTSLCTANIQVSRRSRCFLAVRSGLPRVLIELCGTKVRESLTPEGCCFAGRVDSSDGSSCLSGEGQLVDSLPVEVKLGERDAIEGTGCLVRVTMG